MDLHALSGHSIKSFLENVANVNINWMQNKQPVTISYSSVGFPMTEYTSGKGHLLLFPIQAHSVRGKQFCVSVFLCSNLCTWRWEEVWSTLLTWHGMNPDEVVWPLPLCIWLQSWTEKQIKLTTEVNLSKPPLRAIYPAPWSLVSCTVPNTSLLPFWEHMYSSCEGWYSKFIGQYSQCLCLLVSLTFKIYLIWEWFGKNLPFFCLSSVLQACSSCNS